MKQLFCLAFSFTFFILSCGSDNGGKNDSPTSKETQGANLSKTGSQKSSNAPLPTDPNSVPSSRRFKTLLIAQSQFKANDEGKYTIPEPAVMFLLTTDGDKWVGDKIVDDESNAFHKALDLGNGEILTIGANEAKLKIWKKKDEKWEQTTVWSPTFGGEQNRLRDVEKADLNGDGTQDLAIATHDQGVVAVVWNKDGKWTVEEIDRSPNTFVHEIEIGDLDGDGNLEIYATPSRPNTASGIDQGGSIVRYAWNGEKFVESEVVQLEKRHVKEILVGDIENDGKQELYAALEAQMGPNGTMEAPVEIRRYDWKDGKYVAERITDLKDRFCRFLVMGDIDGDNANEIVASPFSSGVTIIEKDGDKYLSTIIDPDSGGFEHAAYITDIDGDGKNELYVANDKSGSLVRYVYENGKYQPTTVNSRLVPSKAMVWNITAADL